jgi:hypothetical protein
LKKQEQEASAGEDRKEINKQRLTTLFSDAKGKKARENQLRESMRDHRQTMIGAQLEAMGTAAPEDYPVVGETGPVDVTAAHTLHDGDRLGLTSGFADLDVEAASRLAGVPGSGKVISAYRYDKGNNDNIDLKLAAAQRRLTCTSERLEKMSSKEARLKADLNACVLALHRWVGQEEKLCKEVDGELTELIAALAPSTEEQEKAKEHLEQAYATYAAQLISLHSHMKVAEEASQAGREVNEKEAQRIVASNRKLRKDDEEVCGAFNDVIQSVVDQDGLRKLVQGCLNEHMDIEKQIDIARTNRLETREGVTRWGKLLAEERASLQQIRRERRKLVNEEKHLREEAAKITLELIREAQAVAELDFEAVRGPPKDSSAVNRMGQHHSHNVSTQSLNSEASVESVQRMKVVPHGVSANVSTGIEMDYSIPSKPPKGNKKSLFPCLVKDHWSPEDDFSSSVSTTATTFFNTSTQSFSKEFSASFGTSYPEGHIHVPGSRDGVRLVRHLGQNRAGTAEPKLNSSTRSASQTHLPTHQARMQGVHKTLSPATQASGDDLRVAQVGRLRHTPLPMRHESAKGRPTDRGYVPEERWAPRPQGMRVGFGKMPDRTY